MAAGASPAKRILLLVGDFVEDYEVMVPFQALTAFGLSVDAVCPNKEAGQVVRTAIHDVEGDQTYTEKRGHNFALNKSWPVDASDYDALLIPGGRAPEYLSINEEVLALVRAFSEAKKAMASICHGQLILAAAGVLSGRKCTAFPAVKPALVAAGAHWLPAEPISACFIDDNLVTGAAWPGHPEFIAKLLQVMGAKIEGSDKSVLFIVGDFVESYEVMVPFQSLQALGYTVHAVCPAKKAGESVKTAVHDFEGDQTYTEKPGHNFTLNHSFHDVDVGAYDALVIPGGRAPEYLSIDESVLAMVRSFVDAKKPIASICHGQLILAAANVLQGRKCTAYPAVKPVVKAAGAEWLAPDPITKCFTDGLLITAAAWPAHPEFVSHIMTALNTRVLF